MALSQPRFFGWALAAAELGFDASWLQTPDGVRLLVGNALPEGVWAGVVEGLRFVWNNKVLRTLAIVDLAEATARDVRDAALAGISDAEIAATAQTLQRIRWNLERLSETVS